MSKKNNEPMPPPRILIGVAFFQTPSSYLNLLYFLRYGILPREEYHYIIAVNGESTIRFPTLPNLTVIRRPNIGFDFGAHEAIVRYIGRDRLAAYEFFIFLNGSVIGPILRNGDGDWVRLFHERFRNGHDVGLLGTTIVCLPATDAGGFGPRVEGFFWCTDLEGMHQILDETTILTQHPTKYSAIVHGEYGLSRCMLRHGRNLGCMLRRYDGIDWRRPNEWHHNRSRHPSRHNSFYGSSIDPYEVVFHKWHWEGQPRVNYPVIEDHILRKNRESFADRPFVPSSYRNNNPDLSHMDDQALTHHFFLYGFLEDRAIG